MINNSSKAYFTLEIVTLQIRSDTTHWQLCFPPLHIFWGGVWNPGGGYDNKHAHCLQSDCTWFTRAGPGCWFAYLRFCSPSDWGCGQACIALGSAGRVVCSVSCGVLVCGGNDLTYICQIEVMTKKNATPPSVLIHLSMKLIENKPRNTVGNGCNGFGGSKIKAINVIKIKSWPK